MIEAAILVLCTYLERRVPASGNVIGEGRTRSNFSSKTEITDLKHIIIDEEVFGFHIAMEEAVFMHVGEPAGDLKDHTSS